MSFDHELFEVDTWVLVVRSRGRGEFLGAWVWPRSVLGVSEPDNGFGEVGAKLLTVRVIAGQECGYPVGVGCGDTVDADRRVRIDEWLECVRPVQVVPVFCGDGEAVAVDVSVGDSG